jgi:hypothetical protein
MTPSPSLFARLASRVFVLTLLLATCSAARAITINFDDLPAAPFSAAGNSVPLASQLTNQYAGLGVLFESLGGFAAVVDLGSGTPSVPNAIAATTIDGLISYNVPIHIRFVSPLDASIPAATNSVSIRGDTFITSVGTNTMLALDINGSPIDFDIQIEPPASLLTVTGAGIHEVILIGSGSTAFDDLSFEPLYTVPEPTSLLLAAIAAIGLIASRRRRHSVGSR